ncbi:MAG TPA: diadenylate cyclase CdaA [Planktothrix sp.]|jgi:diadenylate cyclase
MHNLGDLLQEINWLTALKLFVQTVIICYCTVWIWKRILGTQAERLVKGVMVLIGVCLLSYFAGFSLITSILQQVIPVAVIALLIIFQPEVRRGLGYLGRMKAFSVDFSLPDSEETKTQRDIQQIITAVRELSRTKVGALLVVEPPEGERDYLSPGTPINADISSTLLLSIFFPNSPLHDGAVVVRRDKIVAAGVILPMTDDPKLSYKYGTRHRAAIGLSEIYDGLCIVVSEETGSVSAASRGMLVRYSEASELADPLTYLYHQHTTQPATQSPLSAFLTLFGRGKHAHEAPHPTIKPVLQRTTLPLSVHTSETEQIPPAETNVPDPRLSLGDASVSLQPPEPEQVL